MTHTFCFNTAQIIMSTLCHVIITSNISFCSSHIVSYRLYHITAFEVPAVSSSKKRQPSKEEVPPHNVELSLQDIDERKL